MIDLVRIQVIWNDFLKCTAAWIRNHFVCFSVLKFGWIFTWNQFENDTSGLDPVFTYAVAQFNLNKVHMSHVWFGRDQSEMQKTNIIARYEQPLVISWLSTSMVSSFIILSLWTLLAKKLLMSFFPSSVPTTSACENVSLLKISSPTLRWLMEVLAVFWRVALVAALKSSGVKEYFSSHMTMCCSLGYWNFERLAV